jgi:hypothetical protein
VYQPFQGLADDRSQTIRVLGVLAFWLTLPFAVLGAMEARRRSMSLIPFVSQVVFVTFTAIVG